MFYIALMVLLAFKTMTADPTASPTRSPTNPSSYPSKSPTANYPVITCATDQTLESGSPGSETPPDAFCSDVEDGEFQGTLTETIIFAGQCPQEDVINYKFTCTDNDGRTSTCEQVTTIQDTTPPVITLPADITLTYICGTLADTGVNETGVATCVDGNQDPDPHIEFTDEKPNPNRINRTWTCTDDCGNSVWRVQTIKLVMTGTCNPTTNPTRNPTTPTNIPTISPTNIPTISPTNPSAHPTTSPTISPTNPSAYPTIPSAYPTISPTDSSEETISDNEESNPGSNSGSNSFDDAYASDALISERKHDNDGANKNKQILMFHWNNNQLWMFVIMIILFIVLNVILILGFCVYKKKMNSQLQSCHDHQDQLSSNNV